MRTLWSVSVFGLVPIPPTDAQHDEQGSLAGNNHYTLIIDRMATNAELSRIRQELEALGVAGTRHPYWRLLPMSGSWRRVRS
jgi:hypothetical protein